MPCQHGFDPAICAQCALENKTNVIQFAQPAAPIWERLPDRFVEGTTFRLCRLPSCQTSLYSKGLCNPHYQQMRLGRIDPITGVVNYQRTPSAAVENTSVEQITKLPSMGPIADWVYIGDLREFVNKNTFRRINMTSAVELEGQVVRALVRNNKFEKKMWQQFIAYNPIENERIEQETGIPVRPPEDKEVFNLFMPSKMMWAKSMAASLPEPLEILLKTLTGGSPAERRYLEQWLAFTIKNPSRLGSALVLRGVHGSGKSVFAALLKTIYGPYAATVRIADLENDFNSWLEGKLMLFGDEMASGGFREQIKTMNELKKYISGGQVTINRKGVPQYSTDVVARWMLFSNAKKPIIIEPTERRYSIIESFKVLPPEIGREIDENRVKYAQALLDYLFICDLDDFHAWTILENETLQKIKAASEGHFD